MKVVRDLIGGGKPSAIELPFNNEVDGDSATTAYKGSLTKRMNFDDIDHGGAFHINYGVTTAGEDFSGILEEEHTAGFLPEDATYDTPLTKITPCFPSTIIRGEYSRKDAAGSDNTDTGGVVVAGSATFTVTITSVDTFIGGWIYMLDGAAAGELHYVINNSATVTTTGSNWANAVASGDTFLAIEPAGCHFLDFDGTWSGIKSEVDDGSKANAVNGIMNYIEAPGIPFGRLQRSKHEGLVIQNARFYHDFTIGYKNVWVTPIVA